MSINMHPSDSQPDLLALKQSSIESIRPNRRRSPRIKLPLWQALLIMGVCVIVLLALLARSLMGWFTISPSAQQMLAGRTGASSLVEVINQHPIASGTDATNNGRRTSLVINNAEEAAGTAGLAEAVSDTIVSVDLVESVLDVDPIVAVDNDVAIIAHLSNGWPNYIGQWVNEVSVISERYQVDADLIGSIIEAESTGNYYAVSYAGAVGLMGVMPYGPGFYDRPTSNSLIDPMINLETGTNVLLSFLEIANYDLHLGLAAYNGGFGNAYIAETQQYAAGVLEQYAEMIAIRAGINPAWAESWQLGYEVRWDGDVIQYNQLDENVQPIGRHLVFKGYDSTGTPVEVIGYALPIGQFSGN